MTKVLKLVSWNIAGGRTMRSLEHFDYEDENISYFAETIARLDPDIVCLQETHTNGERSVAHEIAAAAGYEYVYNEPISPSHIDDAYQLGLAVISKTKLDVLPLVMFPYPDFPLYFKSGDPAIVHEKGAQVVRFSGVNLVNVQMLPLPVFGKSYEQGEGAELARKIDAVLANSLKAPLVVCGDFNYDQPSKLYPTVYQQADLQEALPDVLTRPNREGRKATPDHVVCSSDITCQKAEVITTRTDHYLCYAKLLIP